MAHDSMNAARDVREMLVAWAKIEAAVRAVRTSSTTALMVDESGDLVCDECEDGAQ